MVARASTSASALLAAALPMSLRPVMTPGPNPVTDGPTRARFPSIRRHAGVRDRRVGDEGVARRPSRGRAAGRPPGRSAGRTSAATARPTAEDEAEAPRPSDGSVVRHVRPPLGRSGPPDRPGVHSPAAIVAGQRSGRDRPDAGDEGDHQALVELRAGRVLEAGERLVDGQRLAVRPGRRHRRERVADRQDAGDLGDLRRRPGGRR